MAQVVKFKLIEAAFEGSEMILLSICHWHIHFLSDSSNSTKLVDQVTSGDFVYIYNEGLKHYDILTAIFNLSKYLAFSDVMYR